MFEPTLRFGVEMEFSSNLVQHNALRTAVNRALEPLHCHVSESERSDVWTLKSDCSCGWELTTPILEGKEDLRSLSRVVKSIQDQFNNQDLVDNRCGLHIHFDMSGVSRNSLRQVIESFRKVEPLTHSLIPGSRRTNGFCRPLSERCGDMPDDHYSAVNLGRWSQRGDMEIRYHSGTCNHEKIFGWICYLQGVAAKALASGPPQRNISTPEDFWAWMGVNENTDLSDWDREAKEWIDTRRNYLQDHDPLRTRRVYDIAHNIRQRMVQDDRQYHYRQREPMNRAQRREHDQSVLTWAEAHGFVFDLTRGRVVSGPERLEEIYFCPEAERSNDPYHGQYSREIYRLTREVRSRLNEDDQRWINSQRRDMTRSQRRDNDRATLAWAIEHGFQFDIPRGRLTQGPSQITECAFCPEEQRRGSAIAQNLQALMFGPVGNHPTPPTNWEQFIPTLSEALSHQVSHPSMVALVRAILCQEDSIPDQAWLVHVRSGILNLATAIRRALPEADRARLSDILRSQSSPRRLRHALALILWGSLNGIAYNLTTGTIQTCQTFEHDCFDDLVGVRSEPEEDSDEDSDTWEE